MKNNIYIKTTKYINSHEKLHKALIVINYILTAIMYMSFLMLLMALAYKRDMRIIAVVLVCGITFVLVSVFRYFFDAPRPYVKYGYKPAVDKDKQGQSMPSRHVFSAFIIAMSFMWISPKFGIALIVVSVCIAIHRVVVGVHFIKDVVVGALVGIIAGLIYYLI